MTADKRSVLETALQDGSTISVNVALPAGRWVQAIGVVRALSERHVVIDCAPSGPIRRLALARVEDARVVPARQPGRGYGDPPAEDVDRVGEVLNLKGLPDDDPAHWGERSSLKVET